MAVAVAAGTGDAGAGMTAEYTPSTPPKIAVPSCGRPLAALGWEMAGGIVVVEEENENSATQSAEAAAAAAMIAMADDQPKEPEEQGLAGLPRARVVGGGFGSSGVRDLSLVQGGW